MKSRLALLVPWYLAAAMAFMVLGCTPKEGPQVGSQTNWQKLCEESQECGSLECICGTCTLSCESSTTCDDLPGASCIAAEDPGTIALCKGQKPSAPGLCLTSCVSESCEYGDECIAGICTPGRGATMSVTISPQEIRQSLEGFGASLAYAEEDILAHAKREQLLDAMFLDSGFDVVRMRNRYEVGRETDLEPARELLAAASERMGLAPITLMTSGSPPAYLKESASRLCEGNPDTCTLRRLDDGTFDYGGFAQHWVDSLEAYQTIGITPDYISLQNNPNWVPPESSPNEACKFLPSEGAEIVSLNGANIEVNYPGFSQALNAVSEAINSSGIESKIAAPEASDPESLGPYLTDLDSSLVEALAYHMYDSDPRAIDEEELRALELLGMTFGAPLLQTEMRAGGFDTAVLVQAALTFTGATMYLQNDFVSPAAASEEERELALISIEEDDFSLGDAFHSLRHFAQYTQPGWSRVETSSDEESLLATAFIAPTGDALTIVLVNNGEREQSVELALEGMELAQYGSSVVHRTTFDGLERFTNLGSLAPSAEILIPTRALVTIALTSQ